LKLVVLVTKGVEIKRSLQGVVLQISKEMLHVLSLVRVTHLPLQ